MSDTNLAADPAEQILDAGDPPTAVSDAPAEVPAEPAAPPRMVPVDVLVREVTPLRAKIRETDAALDETRRQLSEARQLLERFQRRPSGDDQNSAPVPAPRHQEPSYSQADIDRRAVELNFQRDAAAVSEAGVKAYGQRWADSINILGSFNLNTADFVQSIMDIAGRDKAHEIVHEIAANPETAASLAGMSPNRRIAEIARMSSKPAPAATAPAQPAAPPAKNVSKAPAPAPRVEANAGQVVDWRSDKASDDEFSKGWNERYLRRGDAIRR